MINGSFEAFNSPLLFPAGSTETTGWTVGGPGFVGVVDTLVYSFNAADGANCTNFNAADLAPGATLFQDFLTVPGAVYTISFHVGRGGPGGCSGGIRAEISTGDGIPMASLATFAPSTGWSSVSTLEFQATTASTRLLFRDISIATETVDVLLDNVQIIPEPATGTLLALTARVPLFCGRRRLTKPPQKREGRDPESARNFQPAAR